MLTTPSSGVRKGAWSEEEDTLLRNCIAKYGEGKWHQVPIRAGLNRCRKSCRLRWLNYLQPDIKRGDFNSDEVDLIIRLHKLLGNRWSLIAGRLPGRTANDVKNYWNTHLLKKMVALREEGKSVNHISRVSATTKSTSTRTVIARPRPRVFSKNAGWQIKGKTTSGTEAPRTSLVLEETRVKDSTPPPPPTSVLVQTEGDGSNNTSTLTQYWWDNLFLNLEWESERTTVEKGMTSLFPGELSNLLEKGAKDGAGDNCNQEGDQFGYSSFFPIESEFWDLLYPDHQQSNPPCKL